MMERIDALKALLAKVEADKANATDFCIAPTMGWLAHSEHDAMRAYHGSLDAANALHEAVLPGWDCTLSVGASHASLSEPIGRDPTRGWYPGPEAEADTPARAWLISILKALIAEA